LTTLVTNPMTTEMERPGVPVQDTSRRTWLVRGVRVAIVLVLALALFPQLWGWYHHYAGSKALDRYHGAEALSHFEACLRVKPYWSRSAGTHLLACRAARRANDYEKAQAHLNACQDLLGGTNPEVALEDALLRVGMLCELNEFEQVLRKRMEIDPQRAPLILEALTQGFLRMSRILEAMACLEQWLQRDPDNLQALYLQGKAGVQAHAWEQAATPLRRVVELDPDRDEARYDLARSLMEINRFEEALAHLEYLQQKSPSIDQQVRMARCQQGMGQTRRARQMLEDVLATAPEYGPALLTLGRIQMQNGQLDDAETTLRHAARVQPFDYQCQWQYYQVLSRMEGKAAEAEAQLARAEKLRERRQRLNEISTRLLSTRPHDPALHYEYAMILIELGEKELGAKWLSSALHEDSNYKPAHAALADYYESIGQTEKAKEERDLAKGGPS
jgi:tetratricopeptide (TPR) repeat protein